MKKLIFLMGLFFAIKSDLTFCMTAASSADACDIKKFLAFVNLADDELVDKNIDNESQKKLAKALVTLYRGLPQNSNKGDRLNYLWFGYLHRYSGSINF